MICTCVRCGKQFETRYKTSVCENCHTEVCCVCGKTFELKWPYNAVTCSSKCRGKYMKLSGKTKENHEKAKQTVKEKGSLNVDLTPRRCEYCGSMFVPHSNRQKYCGDDYGPCPVCGKIIKIKDMSMGPQACSKKCRQVLIEDTNLAKYGVKNVFQSEDIKEKSKETCLQKYGVERYQSTNEYREKYLNTVRERFGVDSPLQCEEVKEKMIETTQERYGVMWPCMTQSTKNSSVSKSNQEFKELLEKYIIEFETEFPIENRSYDFHILDTNLLIEIDPTYSHNSYKSHYFENGLDPMYHYNKMNLARKYGYKCINIFDWDNKEKIVENLFSNKETVCDSEIVCCDLSKSDGQEYRDLGMKLVETVPPVKVWSKGSEHIFDKDVQDSQKLLEEGWLPVFNCGYEVYHK